ncbi:MAG: hypothetical protein WBP60_00175 [Gammaproteobacteria bacterium]
MTEFEGVLAYQVRSMLDGIATDLQIRCEATLDEARRRARELLAETRRKARERVAQAVAEERLLMAQSLDKTAAALASRQRRRQQAVDVDRLERGRALLNEALRLRWQDPDKRRAWVRAVIEDAYAILPAGNWHIHYPKEIEEAWLTDLVQQAAVKSAAATTGDGPDHDSSNQDGPMPGASPGFQAVDDVEGGLRILRGSACLEMTIAGLMARADELSSELLAEIYAQDTPPAAERKHG